MPNRIKVEFYHLFFTSSFKNEIFLLKIDNKEFLGKGDCYFNRENGEPFVYHDVDIILRVRKLEKWAKLS